MAEDNMLDYALHQAIQCPQSNNHVFDAIAAMAVAHTLTSPAAVVRCSCVY